MKKTLTALLSVTVVAGLITSAIASPKKRDIDKRDVESTLKKIAGDHYPEDVKIKDVGMVETGIEDPVDKAYFWVFNGILKDKAGYNIYIFDNSNPPNYLGYYAVTLRPMGCGDGYIEFDTGEVDDITGDSITTKVTIPNSGPSKRININNPSGSPSEFVKAPEPEPANQPAAANTPSSPGSKKGKVTPEYRPWHVQHGDRMIEVESAIFVSFKDGQVTIKDAKTGKTVTVPAKDFSEEDQKYLKTVI